MVTPNHANAAPYTYDALTLTVGCVITSVQEIALPASPPTFYVYSNSNINLLSGLTQGTTTPDCGYTLGYAWTWSSKPAYVTMNSANNAQIDIMTNDISQANSSTQKSASVQLVLTDSQSAASSTGSISGNQSFTKTATVNFWLKDPCINAVLTATAVPAMTATNGQTATSTFSKTLDSIEVLNGISTLCGPRTYTICSTNDCSGGAVNWITIAATANVANSFTISASPNTPNNAATIGANTLYL